MKGEDVAVVMVILAMTGAAVFLFRPMVLAWARRIEGKAGNADTTRDLDEVRERLAELEAAQIHVQELEDRVEFAERMLAQRHEQVQLPPTRTPV